METKIVFERVSLHSLREFIDARGYFVCMWYDISEFAGIDVSSRHGVDSIKTILTENNLDCFPKIQRGSVANIEKDLSATRMVFFKKVSALDKTLPGVRHGMLVAKVASIAAKIDGMVTAEEIESIREGIYRLNFISQAEKYIIFIQSIYFFEVYLRRWNVLEDFNSLSVKNKKRIVDIVKNVVVSDSEITRQERLLLYELYRMSGFPTNTVAKDLRCLAKEKGIDLSKKGNFEESDISVSGSISPDDSIVGLFTEFEGF